MKKAIHTHLGKKGICVCIAFFVLFTVGCFALPVEDDVPSVVMNTTEGLRTFRTALVVRGDVVNFSNPSVSHVPARVSELSFNEAGRLIAGVYVTIGDVVREGDILAEIEIPHAQAIVDDLMWDSDWTSLELSQINDRHALALAHAERTGNPVDDSFYLQERARLLDRLEIINMRVEHYTQELENTYIVAPFDGIITQAIFPGEHTISQIGQVVVTVMDQSQQVFRLMGAEAALLQVGEYLEIAVSGMTSSTVMTMSRATARVITPEEYDLETSGGQEAFLSVEGDLFGIAVFTLASVNVVHEQASDVLMIPNIAINRVGDRTFVYIVEDGLRVVRDIGVGVVGNAVSEILWGLYEGEEIVS